MRLLWMLRPVLDPWLLVSPTRMPWADRCCVPADVMWEIALWLTDTVFG